MVDQALTILTDAVIFTGEAFVEGHALVLKNRRIHDIVPNNRAPSNSNRLSYPDHILVPGFIDCQVNGGNNILFNNNPTAEAGVSIAKAHAKYGTARLLLTCITDTPDITHRAITAARAARQENAGVLGIHIEGPHLSNEKRGVHNSEYIRPLGQNDLNLYRPEHGDIMLVTIAPENVTTEQIKELRAHNVKVSLGHTAAKAEQIHAALQAGATCFTHLFNGMGGLNARDPGPAGVALDDRDSWCSIIADGYHVSAENIRLALRAKMPGKLFLVSDAMPPAATAEPQSFQLYGEQIRAEGGRCLSKDGKLAGANLTMLEAVQYCIHQVGIEPMEALQMASTYPAAFLGMDKTLGKLLPGFAADINVLNKKFALKAVWQDGLCL